MSSLEKLLKQELGTANLHSTGQSGGGCINEGSAYDTDHGTIFVKFNSKAQALRMFQGEFESLTALSQADQVKVPKPIKVISNPQGGAMLVMEYIPMTGLSKYAAKLGEQMARLHLHNAELCAKETATQQSVHFQGRYSSHVNQFGFPVTTCCGYLPQENDFMDLWVDILRLSHASVDLMKGWKRMVKVVSKLLNTGSTVAS